MVDVNVNIKVPALEKLADYTASGIGRWRVRHGSSAAKWFNMIVPPSL